AQHVAVDGVAEEAVQGLEDVTHLLSVELVVAVNLQVRRVGPEAGVAYLDKRLGQRVHRLIWTRPIAIAQPGQKEIAVVDRAQRPLICVESCQKDSRGRHRAAREKYGLGAHAPRRAGVELQTGEQ